MLEVIDIVQYDPTMFESSYEELVVVIYVWGGLLMQRWGESSKRD